MKRHLLLGRKAMTNLDKVLKSRNITLLTKVCIIRAWGFPVVMYGCGRWTTKKAVLTNWCFWIVVLEKPLENLLDSKRIKTVNFKGNQSWIYIGRTNAEPEATILWPLGVKNWLIGKDSDAGKDWGKGEKGATEDEIVGWHHWLNGHEFDQTPGNSEEQESLVCAVHGVGVGK